VSVWSVLKVSLIFYVLVLAVFLITGVAIWNVASDFGVVNSLDKLVRSLFALSSFKLHPLTALAWGAAVGAVFCFLGVLVNVVAALLYNLISDLVGGVRVTLTADKDT
jgi:cytochrome b subunit of formate dehydrogenase